MEQNNDAKLVATIAANSPVAFETAMDAVEPEEDKDPQPSVETTANPWESGAFEAKVPSAEPPANPQDPPAAPPTEPPPADPPETTPPDNVDNIPEAVLVAKILQERRPGMFEKIEDDLDWENVVNTVDNYITENLKAGQDYQLEQMNEAGRYVQFLLDGGRPETLQAALQFNDLIDLDIEKAEDSALEQVILTDLGQRLNETDAKALLETIKVKGEIKDRAKASQENLKKREQQILAQEKQAIENERRQAEAYREQITRDLNKTIDQESIMGYKLNDNLRQELRDMIFKANTTMVVQDEQGNNREQKVTEFMKLRAEFDQSLEKQVAFALLLKNNFDLSKLIAEGEQKKTSSLMDELKRRSAGSNLPRVTGRNAYIE